MTRNSAVLDNLREQRDQSRDAAIALAEQEDFDPTSDAYTSLEERAANLDSQIGRLVTLHEQQDAADALDGRLGRAAQRQEREAGRDVEHRSMGQQWTDSDVWRDYNFRGTSSRLDVEQRALPHSLASLADAMPSSPIVDLTPPASPDVLIPLTNIVTVSSNAIDYIVWSIAAGAAEIVAEGALKPSIEWEPNVVSSSLDTVAAWTSFTRQMAEDASAVRSFIDGELQREISKKVEAEAKAAVGAATLPAVAGPAGSGLVGALRAGQAAVQAEGYSPNAFLVASDDLIDLDLATMSQLGGAPSSTPSYWGMRPIVDPDATAGTVIVGDFKAGVQHYRRNNVQLFASDSATADSFLKNVLHVLAEQRAKTVVARPNALAEVTAGA